MNDFVYIVQCADRSFYTGVTNDLARRLRQHNGVQPGGARYTRTRRPVRLHFSLACYDRRKALVLERAIKKLSHSTKASLRALNLLESIRL